MAILGSLELASKRLGTNSRISPLINNAAEAARRGATLTQRMLSFARRQPLNPGSHDVKELVEGMLGLITRSIGPTIKVVTQFPNRLPSVHVDKNQLEMALLNLAVNARDAMPRGGSITICARGKAVTAQNTERLNTGNYVCLSFTDTGEGMDELTLAQAIEPFFTTKGVGKGTGLGLPMVHGMAEQSGGRLILKSIKGEGTTVELWLPAAEAVKEEHQAAANSGPGPAVPLRILAVDDDSLVLFNTVMMLEEMGHAVAQATSAKDALRLLEVKSFDLIITDQAMPEMKGSELVDHVKGRWPNMRLIIATGYQELPDALGSDVQKLAKPFTSQELARALQEANFSQ